MTHSDLKMDINGFDTSNGIEGKCNSGREKQNKVLELVLELTQLSEMKSRVLSPGRIIVPDNLPMSIT